jgi:pentatricopeptide repeat protein
VLAPNYADISRYARRFSYFSIPGQVKKPALQKTSRKKRIKWRPETFIWDNRGKESNEQRKLAREVEREKLLLKVRQDLDAFIKVLDKTGVPKSEREYNAHHWRLVRELYNLERTRLQYIGIEPLAFAALDRKVHPIVRRLTYALEIIHDTRCDDWIAYMFEDVKSEEELRSRWKAVEDNQDAGGSSVWQAILFHLLDNQPRRALDFLRITGCDPGRDPKILATSMEYLARLFANTRSKFYSTKEAGRMLVNIFCDIYQQQLHIYPSICASDLLSHIPKQSDPSTLPDVYDMLLEHSAIMNQYTLLHWVEVFADHGYIQRALQVLQRVATHPGNSAPGLGRVAVRGELFSKACTHVLDRCVKRSGDYHLIPEIVAKLTEMGVRPGIFANNVVIRHAMAAGDVRTALRVYEAMEDSGIKPDKVTYSTLLARCSRSDDRSMFRAFAEQCKAKVYEFDDPVLAADYLYYISVLHTLDERKPSESLSLLLDVYSEFFELAPLQILQPDLDPSRLAAGLELPAEPRALFIVLSAQIRAAAKFDNTHVLRLYQHFRTVSHPTKDPHPAIASLAQTRYIYNVFLKAFCDGRQFASASALITDMTNSSAIDVPEPGILAWTIFMSAFFRNDQPETAERVFKIMKERGVEPDKITWLVLLKHYAKSQQIDKVVDVLQNVDLEQDLDPDLLAALNKVHQRTILQHALDQQMKAREKQRTTEKPTYVWENIGGVWEGSELETDERWYRRKERKDK